MFVHSNVAAIFPNPGNLADQERSRRVLHAHLWNRVKVRNMAAADHRSALLLIVGNSIWEGVSAPW